MPLKVRPVVELSPARKGKDQDGKQRDKRAKGDAKHAKRAKRAEEEQQRRQNAAAGRAICQQLTGAFRGRWCAAPTTASPPRQRNG